MSLFVEGNKKKIKQYRDRAERDGLIIRLYSEQVGIPRVEFTSEPENQLKKENEKTDYKAEFLNLDPTAQRILEKIRELGRVRPIALSRALGIANGRVLYFAKQSEAKEYIDIDRVSKKLTYYSLNGKGKELFE